MKKRRVKNTGLRLTEYHIKLLKYFSNNTLVSTMAKRFDCTKTNIYQISYTLQKHGYMTKEAGSFYLTTKGSQAVKNTPLVSQKIKFNSSRKKNEIRLHDLRFNCFIKTDRSWKNNRQKILRSRKIPFKSFGFGKAQDSFFYDNVEIRLTNRMIIFVIKEIFAGNPHKAKEEAIKILRNITPKIENIFKVSIEKPNRVSIEVSHQHNAIIYNEIARQFLQADMEFKLYNREGDLIAIADDSLGFKELEFIHPVESEEHTSLMKQEIDNIITGKIKRYRKRVNTRLDNLERRQDFKSKEVDYVG